MALSDVYKRKKVKVVDLLKEQELLKAKYFASDDVPFIIRSSEENDYLEKQMVKHYDEVSDALLRYLEIEDILSVVYAEYTIQVLGYPRITVATAIKILKEMEFIDKDKLSGHLIVSQHPMAVFLNKCYAGQMNYLPEEVKVLDPNDLLDDDTCIEDVSYKVEQFKVELGYALEKFYNETEV